MVTIPWRYADYLIYIGFGIALMGFCGQADEARLIVIGGGGPLMPVWQVNYHRLKPVACKRLRRTKQ